MELTRQSNCRGRVIRPGKFFSNLSLPALNDFSAIERASAYPEHFVLFTEGSQQRALFVVLTGGVLLSINSSEGKRLSMHIAKPGDIIGLSSALSGTQYDVTAETLHPSQIASVEQSEFLKFLTRHPEAYKSATAELGRQVTDACSQLRTLGLSSSSNERLARLLLDWSDDDQATGGGSRFRVSLTHEEIGDFIATSRETVTRSLSAFKDRRLVAFDGSLMTIPSRSALELYACA